MAGKDASLTNPWLGAFCNLWGKGHAMEFGTFLLLQSPSARFSPEIYTRRLEIAQAAEALGFRNMWLTEHHFSTYGYLSRSLQMATYIAAKNRAFAGGHGGDRGAFAPPVGDRRGDRHSYERVEHGRAIAVPRKQEPETDDLLDRFLVIGTPDTCIRQIKRMQELVGISHFNCSFWFGDLEHRRVLRSMELFAKEVMPALK